LTLLLVLIICIAAVLAATPAKSKATAGKSKAAASKGAASKGAASKGATSKAAAPSKATGPKPYLNTRLVGMHGRKTGLRVKQVIRNAGSIAVSGVTSTITIGTLYMFYQFRRGSEKICKFTTSTNMVSCTFPGSLAPKQNLIVWLAAANKKGTRDEEVSKKSTKPAKKSKAATSKAAGAPPSTPTGTITAESGWKATVQATGMDYSVSAPLYLKPKANPLMAM